MQYAEPSDIERFSFKPAWDGLVAGEHILPPNFSTFLNLEYLTIERSLKELRFNDFGHAMNSFTMW